MQRLPTRKLEDSMGFILDGFLLIFTGIIQVISLGCVTISGDTRVSFMQWWWPEDRPSLTVLTIAIKENQDAE